MSRILIKDRNGRILVENALLTESTLARMQGLLGRKELAKGTGMLIRPCRSIHMWFMRFPIDAAFLDAGMRVLKVSRNLRPWRIALGPRKTACVLETARGGLAGIHPGDTLSLED